MPQHSSETSASRGVTCGRTLKRRPIMLGMPALHAAQKDSRRQSLQMAGCDLCHSRYSLIILIDEL